MQNDRQKLILRVGAAAATLLLLFPNFVCEFGDGGALRGLGYSFIFSPKGPGYIHVSGLLAEIAVIVAVCAMLWLSESEMDKLPRGKKE